MPIENGAGYSRDTAIKQQNLGYVLEVLMRVAMSLRCMGADYAHKEYLYFDLNAGPGVLDGQEGSPLVFLRLALDLGLPFHAWLFEREEENCQALRAALAHGLAHWLYSKHGHADSCRGCMCCCGGCAEDWISQRFSIVSGDHNETIAGVISDDVGRRVRKKWTYGLVYADPNGKLDLPLGPMRALATRLEKVDQLINVSATTYKRVRGAGMSGDFLLDDLATVDKQHCMIRRPVGTWQWTMALLTNWVGCPEFSRIGFRNVRSVEGAQIARSLNFRSKELDDSPLFDWGPAGPGPRIGPMPSTSVTRDSSPFEPQSLSGAAASASGATPPAPPSRTT